MELTKVQKTLLALLLVAVAGLGWVFFAGTTSSSDLPEYSAPQRMLKPGPAAHPVESFDQIKLEIKFYGGWDTIEINGNGKIRFISDEIPEGKEGSLSAEQIEAILKSINENNFDYVVHRPPNGVSCDHTTTSVISLTINGAQQTATHDGCGTVKEFDNISRAITTAAENFVTASLINAAHTGNYKAQIALAHSYSEGWLYDRSTPKRNPKEAYFWISICKKSWEKTKTTPDKPARHGAIYLPNDFWLDSLEKEILPQDLAEVKKRVEEWKSAP
jgi:hypothetical protein